MNLSISVHVLNKEQFNKLLDLAIHKNTIDYKPITCFRLFKGSIYPVAINNIYVPNVSYEAFIEAYYTYNLEQLL